MKTFTFAVLVVVAVSAFAENPRQDATLAVAVPLRPGVTELDTAAAATAVREVVRDPRYAALAQIAQDRGLHFQQLRAKELQLPEGDYVTVIPAFSANNEERGFLARSADDWTLALELPQPTGNLIETYRARVDTDTHVTVEAVPAPELGSEHMESPGRIPSMAPNAIITYPTTSCSYVSRYSMNVGCINLKSNPFGYYYVITTRTGYTPDPRSPSWWACYRGSIHICPRYETRTPITMPVCGFPPGHPNG
jgi:hypothetical protein